MSAPVRSPTAVSAELADRLVYLAARAPSPHNAQGWRIEVDGARLRISADPQRRVLRELDPHGREGDLACGAAVHNLRVGASALGYAAEVTWRPQPGVAADVELTAALPGPQRLAAIRDRAMNRSAYRPDPVDPALLERLQAAAGADGFGLAVATGADAIGEVALAAADAGRIKLSHAPTQRELYALMRFSARSAARSRDGLDLELFFTSARAGAVALRPRLVGPLAASVARRAEALPILSSPAVCLLYADALDAETFLRGGAAFGELGLQITEAGLAYALHSAPIELALAGAVPAPWRAVHDRMLRGFGLAAGVAPIALLRLGTPSRRPQRRSLRRHPVAVAPEQPHYRELTRRNTPSIPAADQRALRELRVLFAGCGSIGGAPVEPLVRMGLEQLVLAEPGDYELNNLNRQAALLDDVGHNKAAVLAARARAVNPHAQVLVEPAGVTAENVDWLVGTADVIVDGVDVTERSGIAAKRLLHEEAWRQRRVVIAGLDLGGTQLVLVYDYRDGRTRPFWGRLDGAGEDLDALALLSRMISPLDMPRELLAYAEAVIRGEEGSPPQLAPTANQFGVLAAWAVLDVACGRPLRRKARVAIPDVLMTRRRRVRNEAARAVELAKVKLLLEVKRARQGV